MAKPAHAKHVEINEEWLLAWVGYGLAEMTLYLVRHAQFADYLATLEAPDE